MAVLINCCYFLQNWSNYNG